MTRTLGRALFVVALLAEPASSFAQTDDLGTQQARALFEAGRAAFEAAQYEDALQHFRQSYRISGRSALLYNIGVSADRLGRDAEALEAFEGYLRDAPADAPQRADAEVRVRVLRRRVEEGGERSATETSETTAARETTPHPSGGTPGAVLAGWGIFGGGLAVLAAGAIMLGVGQADASVVEGQPDGTPWTPELADAASRAEWARIGGWVLAGIGLAAAVGGITLVFITPTPTESAALELRPGGLAFVWRHR
jgi:tetratricopeptide (TPR) repeat protein